MGSQFHPHQDRTELASWMQSRVDRRKGWGISKRTRIANKSEVAAEWWHTLRYHEITASEILKWLRFTPSGQSRAKDLDTSWAGKVGNTLGSWIVDAKEVCESGGKWCECRFCERGKSEIVEPAELIFFNGAFTGISYGRVLSTENFTRLKIDLRKYFVSN